MGEALNLLLQRTQYITNYNKPSYQVLADVLKSCAATLNAKFGKSLHSHVIKLGDTSCRFITKALLNMYAKCRALEDCQKLFEESRGRGLDDTVTWNILLSGLSSSRHHDHKVMRLFKMFHAAQDPTPSTVTLAIVLPVCTRIGTRDAGKSIHAYAVKSGIDSQTLVGNALMSMYAKCGLVLDASAVFRGITDKDVVSYNAAIAGSSENKLVENAFELFCEMIKGPVMPNYATIANILPMCAAMGNTLSGKEIHCYVLRRTELENEVTVINALLSFYLRIGRTREAHYLFERMRSRDLVSWNSMIVGCALNGQWLKALEIFCEFVDKKIDELDSVTVISILRVCAHLPNLKMGKEIHGYVLRHNVLHEDISVGNSLINFYAKCCLAETAFRVFLHAPRKDLISWNTMLDAFGLNLLENQFTTLLRWMFVDGIKPDAITILTVVQLCSNLSRIRNHKEAHGFSLRSGILLGDSEPTLGNALLDAYAKCGNMEYALRVFETLSGKRNVVTCNSMISGYFTHGLHDDANTIFQCMSERDLTTWNLMVRGYALNECPNEAVNLFRELHYHGMRPDSMTMMSILPVCGQMASIHFLRQCHGYIIRACFEDTHLKASLLDVYSKCGSILSAYKLYRSTPQTDLVVFTAMVGGFAMHGMGNEAIGVFHCMLECGIKPDHVVVTTILSACRHAGLINEGLMIFDSIVQVHNMEPSMEQYACVVDLLGRGGRTKEAFSFLKQMPVAANASIWGTLLGACRTHHDVETGRVVADHLLKIETSDIGNYVVLSNLYAADAKWDGVSEMRRLMKKSRDLKKPAGCSWIEISKSKNAFVAGDYCHPERNLIYSILSHLDKQIKEVWDITSFLVVECT